MRDVTLDEEQMTSQTDIASQEIEGLGENQPDLFGDYPIDELLIRNEDTHGTWHIAQDKAGPIRHGSRLPTRFRLGRSQTEQAH